MAEGFSDPPDASAEGVGEGETESSAHAVSDPGTYRLLVPIPVPGKGGMREISEVAVRRPTGMDILQVGNPVIFDPVSDPPRITHDHKRMPDMIFRLTSLTPPVLAKMDPQDLVGLFWHITPFFMPPVGRI